jgi:hypothetical protein
MIITDKENENFTPDKATYMQFGKKSRGSHHIFCHISKSQQVAVIAQTA